MPLGEVRYKVCDMGSYRTLVVCTLAKYVICDTYNVLHSRACTATIPTTFQGRNCISFCMVRIVFPFLSLPFLLLFLSLLSCLLICLPRRTCVWFLHLPPSLPPSLPSSLLSSYPPPSLPPSLPQSLHSAVPIFSEKDEKTGWLQAAGRSRVLFCPRHQSGTDAHLLPRRPGGGVAGGMALVVTHLYQRRHDNVTCKQN